MPDVIEVLRLHTDKDGFVWYGDDTQLAVNTFLEPSDFFTSDVFGVSLDDVRRVRLLGVKENASLIVELQNARLREKIFARRQRVQLCSPAVVATESMRQDPEAVLQHLWQPSCSSSLHGQWYDLSESDYYTYAMIANVPVLDGPVPEVVHRIAKKHPAWTAFSFIKTLDQDSACRLICEVVDPRWYRNPFHPHRINRLYNYLGLTPQNMQALCGRGTPGRHHYRAMLAVRSWYNQRLLVPQNRYGPLDFIWQTFRDAKDKAKGLLRGTQQLIRLVIGVWAYAKSSHHPEASFRPSDFFKNPEEAAAFETHRTRKKV